MQARLDAPRRAARAVAPERLSAAQLEGLGVRRLNRYNLLLECARCGSVWSPRPGSGGVLPRGYWHCPNRCNC